MLIDCEVARELQWFPLCNVDVQFNCWALKSMWASLFLKNGLLKFPGWARIASSWLICISKERRRDASLDCHWVWNAEDPLTVSLKCASQIVSSMEKYFSRILVYRSCGVVFELVLKIILQISEYQTSSYPPKNIPTPILGDIKSEFLSVISGEVMMGLRHAAQFQLLKISWNGLWRFSFVSLQE